MLHYIYRVQYSLVSPAKEGESLAVTFHCVRDVKPVTLCAIACSAFGVTQEECDLKCYT